MGNSNVELVDHGDLAAVTMAAPIFVTTGGISVPLRPISLQQLELVRINATKEADRLFGKPQVPTYEEELFGGEKQISEHNESTLETDADRAAWKAYQEKLKEYNEYISQRVSKFVLLTGTDMEMPADQSWMELQQYFGIEIPSSHPLDLKAHWLSTEVIRTVHDIQGISNRILEVSGVSDELKQASQNSFSGALEE